MVIAYFIFIALQNYTGFVLNVTAVDTDDGVNGIICFEFTLSEDEKYFKLDKSVGTILINDKTDRENKPFYEVSMTLWFLILSFYRSVKHTCTHVGFILFSNHLI